MSAQRAPVNLSPTATSGPSADVCLIVEGCYPYVQGGVAAWIDWLMRSQPDLSFSIVALWPRPGGLTPRYQLPPNAVQYQDLYLQDFGNRPRLNITLPDDISPRADTLSRFTAYGGAEPMHALARELERLRLLAPLPVVFNSATPSVTASEPTRSDAPTSGAGAERAEDGVTSRRRERRRASRSGVTPRRRARGPSEPMTA